MDPDPERRPPGRCLSDGQAGQQALRRAQLNSPSAWRPMVRRMTHHTLLSQGARVPREHRHGPAAGAGVSGTFTGRCRLDQDSCGRRERGKPLQFQIPSAVAACTAISGTERRHRHSSLKLRLTRRCICFSDREQYQITLDAVSQCNHHTHPNWASRGCRNA